MCPYSTRVICVKRLIIFFCTGLYIARVVSYAQQHDTGIAICVNCVLRFADTRDRLRFEVEESFYELRQANRNIQTTSREVLSSRESLRLARLRFQAGVSTQREVVDNQRDLTQAEVRYAQALAQYNISVAEMRRRTGLDQVAVCQATSLGATKPVLESMENIPVPPEPLQPACQASIPAKAAS